MRARLASFGCDPLATVFERALEDVIRAGGFPKPVRQHPVRVDGKLYFLDHFWPEHGKWSECDSMRFTYFDVHHRPDYVTEILASHLPRSPNVGTI